MALSDRARTRAVFLFLCPVLTISLSILIYSHYIRIYRITHELENDKIKLLSLSSSYLLSENEVSTLINSKYTNENPVFFTNKLLNFSKKYNIDCIYFIRVVNGQIEYLTDYIPPSDSLAMGPGLARPLVEAANEPGAIPAWEGEIVITPRIQKHQPAILAYAPVIGPEGHVMALAVIELASPAGPGDKTFLALALALVNLAGLAPLLLLCRCQGLNESLRTSITSRSVFLARISQEIRAPLNAIMGLSDLLMRHSLRLPQQSRAFVRQIRRSGANLMALIDDILDFSHLDSQKLAIIEGPYSLSTVINDVISVINARLQEKTVRFLAEVSPAIPDKLVGDPTRLRQILLNLLTNAVKFTESGSITFSVAGHEHRRGGILLSVTVEDTGQGIAGQDLEHLLDDRGRAGPDGQSEGPWLGLAITGSLCRMMGGAIKADSIPGRGSTFMVTLPQGIALEGPLAKVDRPSDLRVLLSERRQTMAASLVAALESLGVKNRLVPEAELLPTLEGEPGAFSHVIAPVPTFDALAAGLSSHFSWDRIAVMVKDVPPFNLDRVRYLFTPVYSRPLAFFLNNCHDETEIQGLARTWADFTAPTARVLVVDDRPTNLAVAEGLLAPYGLAVDLCRGGDEALAKIRENSYDLVLIDRFMPGMDGLAAAARIRELPLGAKGRLPIVGMAAQSVDGLKEKFLKAGLDDYLPKPVESVKLHALLLKWIPREKCRPSWDDGLVPPAGGGDPLARLDLPDIPGLDVGKALVRLGGRHDLYVLTLRGFVGDVEDLVRLLPQMISDGDSQLLTLKLHVLKMAARSIGALAISERAAMLESAGRLSDWTFIEENHGSLLMALGQMVEPLAAFLKRLPDGPGPGPAS